MTTMKPPPRKCQRGRRPSCHEAVELSDKLLAHVDAATTKSGMALNAAVNLLITLIMRCPDPSMVGRGVVRTLGAAIGRSMAEQANRGGATA